MIGIGLIVSIVILAPCCCHNYIRLCSSCIHGTSKYSFVPKVYNFYIITNKILFARLLLTVACCKFCFRPPIERGTAQELSSLRKSEV